MYRGLRLAHPADTAAPARKRPAHVGLGVRDVSSLRRVDLGGGGSSRWTVKRMRTRHVGVLRVQRTDGNGAQGAGQPRLPNWTIDLCSDSACGTILETATTTGSNGAYAFSVRPGPYYVREVRAYGPNRAAPSGGFSGPSASLPPTRQRPASLSATGDSAPSVLEKSLTGGSSGYADQFRSTTTARVRPLMASATWPRAAIDRVRGTHRRDLHGHRDHFPRLPLGLVRSRLVFGYLRHHGQ